MEYSDLYNEDTTVVIDTDITLSLTAPIFSLFSNNSEFDLSFSYSTSPSWRKLKHSVLTASGGEISNRYGDGSINIFLGKRFNSYIDYYQFGKGAYTGTFSSNAGLVRGVRNLTIRDVLFYVSGNVVLYNPETKTNVTKTFLELINSNDNDLNNLWVDFDNLVFGSGYETFFPAYIWNEEKQHWVYSQQISPCFFINSSKISGVSAGYINGRLFNFLGVQGGFSWFTNTGAPYSFAGNVKFRDFDNSPQSPNASGLNVLRLFPNGANFTVGLSPNVNDFYSNGDIGLLITSVSTVTTGKMLFKASFLKKLLAGMCFFFTDVLPTSDNSSLLDLIEEGHIWCGEMDNNGVGTDKWLHSLREVISSNTYENTSQNLVINPYLDGDDDSDVLALQLIGENKQLAKFLHYYTLSESDVDELKENIDSALVENPMQYMLSLKEIPAYFERFITGGMVKSEIRLGPWIASSATGYRINSSDAVCPVGSKFINRYFNNFLDYAPYTHINLYLPYCGTVELPVDIVMGKELSIFYSFDFESLNCNAMVFSSGAYLTNVHGNISKDYSLSSTNGFLKALNSAIAVTSLTATLAGTVMMPSLGLVLPSQVGNVVNSLGRNYSMMRESSNDFTNFKSPQRCCLFISRPKLEDLTGYRKTVGIRCEKYGKLGQFHGLTVCRNPHIEIPCTSEEKLLIKEKLENGVILP